MKFFAPAIAFLLFAQTTFAYTLAQTSNGQNVRWRYGQKLFLAGNPYGVDSFDSTLFWNAAVNGLQQWKWATGGQFDFEYWQGTDPRKFPENTTDDSISNIFFASSSGITTDPNVIGFTQVSYNDNTGNITDIHVMLNDVNFQLTSSISDTTAKPAQARSRPKVYLNNIITHELGHALGLSHSGNINSSMLYVEFPEQAKIACDDWAGVQHLYPDSGSGTGQLDGTILSPNGDPVAGAQVTAISQSRGIPIATVLTNQSGNYHFGALASGEVGLMVQPFQGSAAAIPTALQAKVTSFCGTSTYPTNFVTEDDGHTFKKIPITPAQTTPGGSYRLHCAALSASNANFSNNASDFFADVLQAGNSRTYAIPVNGQFSLSGIAYLLLSPIKVSLTAVDSSGNNIPLSVQSPLYQSTSNFVIPDTQITGTANGTIFVTATASALKQGSYPVAISPAATSYFALIQNSNGPNRSPDSTPALPDNARCSPPETFAAYQSPPGDPIRFATTSSGRDGVGFCGSAHAGDFGKDSNTRRVHPSNGAILGWFFPFLVLLLTQLFSKLRRARLNEA